MNHAQAYADRQYLWSTYGPAEDMTGGYVDQEDLERLLANPTRTVATDCLVRQIQYWFDVGPDLHFRHTNAGDWREDERVLDIAARHAIEIPPRGHGLHLG